MGDIKISDISQTGKELFDDSESFLEELDDREINDVKGGVSIPFSINNYLSTSYCPPSGIISIPPNSFK